MGFYFGSDSIKGINLGDIPITSVCAGDTIIWNDEPTPVGPTLYTEDDGATLVVGTTYSIPTTIYKESGDPEVTTTTLSTPFKISNLTQSAYGDTYMYSPQLSTFITHTSMTPVSITKDGQNFLDDLYKNRTASTSYPTCSHTKQVRSGNSLDQAAYHTIRLTNIPEGYENAKLSVNATTRCSRGYTDEARLDCYLRVLGTDGTTVLGESSLLDKAISGTNATTYVSFPFTPEIPIPSNGFKIGIQAVLTNSANNTPTFDAGRLNFRLIKYFYDTPLYCNIRRTIYNMGGTVDDRLNINISTNDTYSQYMISLTEQGIATITEKPVTE